MAETEQDRAHLEMRRRRLRFRAWHRGTLEMDFVVGRFADAELAGMNGEEIAQLEALMDLPDPDLFGWVVGQAAVPPQYDTPVFRRMAEFHRSGRGRQPG
ncbi:MAG: succinate dehydrogenase assembly factor 2 [Bradyrhizobiaceae bacterium]|nr:succinate dehydrogenase assembly factor 2 [Bradyrhizobiaceae bacterium]